MSAHHFTNVTGKGRPFIFPSFSFLPVSSRDVALLDCCNGLLLCRCFQPGPAVNGKLRPFHYAVCNPATEKWAMLPDGSWASGEARSARLCFDPNVSPHFHVIEFVEDEDEYATHLEIYSSATGSWIIVESAWDGAFIPCDDRRSVFLNGLLHSVMISDAVVAVDMEGKTWRTFPTPTIDERCYIHQAQGQLWLINAVDDDPSKLSIWTLEADAWILKHTVSTLYLFGGKRFRFDFDYKVIGIHPEGNIIFFVFGRDNTLMAYITDRREVRVIRNLGYDCCGHYLSYVPLFSKSLVDEQ